MIPTITDNLHASKENRADADHYMWQNELQRRKKQPQKRGRPKISFTDLEKELEIKKEKVRKMDNSLKKLQDRAKDEVIEESDLEEYEELLATDDEDSVDETGDVDGHPAAAANGK